MTNPFKVNGVFNFKLLIILLLLPQVVGWASGFLSMGSAEVYQTLKQPSFAPPGWIFAPVWTLLYFLMGLASYRIILLIAQNKSTKLPFNIYLLQLLFNFFWTIIFFRWELRGIAFSEIIILLVLILIITILFFRVDKIAGSLMVPYLLWVSFASVLNYSVYQLNKI
ncbi:MAG: TspO/MBR family protein [Ignavibacteriaceae bacterium]